MPDARIHSLTLRRDHLRGCIGVPLMNDAVVATVGAVCGTVFLVVFFVLGPVLCDFYIGLALSLTTPSRTRAFGIGLCSAGVGRAVYLAVWA